MSTSVHPVDEFLPYPRLFTLGLQHVLVMYAGAVAVPLIIGRALKLPPEQIAVLINADLFACGIATLIQSIGFPGVGIRLPVMMGVTFASVAPMLAMAGKPGDRPSRHLRRGDRGRHLRHPGRAVHQPHAAAVPAGRHRHDHHRDRHLADAGRHQLGGRRPADARPHGRRPDGAVRQSELRRARRPRHRAVRAGRHPGDHQIRQGLPLQRRGAARHRRRRGPCGRPRQDAFRQGRERVVVRRGLSVPVRAADVRPRGVDHDVPGDDRGDDRIRPACSSRSAR